MSVFLKHTFLPSILIYPFLFSKKVKLIKFFNLSIKKMHGAFSKTMFFSRFYFFLCIFHKNSMVNFDKNSGTSDNTDACDRLTIQDTYSYIYPIKAMRGMGNRL